MIQRSWSLEASAPPPRIQMGQEKVYDVFACAGLSWGEHLSPSPTSDACSWRSSTPSPPLSEGGSTSTFWSQVTTDEGIVIDEYDELPRKKKVSTGPARSGSFKLHYFVSCGVTRNSTTRCCRLPSSQHTSLKSTNIIAYYHLLSGHPNGHLIIGFFRQIFLRILVSVILVIFPPIVTAFIILP